MHRLTLRSGLIAVTLLLSIGGVALAKEGGQASLDAPIPPDAEPGSTIEVGWRAWVLDDGAESPVIGSPLFIRLTSRDGSETVEASGRESPSGSGHYVATVTVPQDGVSVVAIGMRGSACVDGVCARSDVEFALGDADRLPGLGAASGGSAPDGSTVRATQPTGPGSSPLLLVVVLLAVALGMATTGAAARLRRSRLTGPAAGS